MENLTRDAILAAEDLKMVPVDVPEWGGRVYVRILTGLERDRRENEIWLNRNKPIKVSLRARLVSLSACTQDGKRLFADSDVVDLGTKSAAALDRIFTAAQKINRMTAEDVQDLEKN
jgi:hypothetical protein